MLLENDFDHTSNEDNLELLEQIFSVLESSEIEDQGNEIIELISWAIVSRYSLNFSKKEPQDLAIRCADAVFKITVANRHLQIPYFASIHEWLCTEYADARTMITNLPDLPKLEEFLNLDEQRESLLSNVLAAARSEFGIEEPSAMIASGPLEVVIDNEGYSTIGKYRFSPSGEMTYENRLLRKPNTQIKILLEYLIDSYAKGFGLPPKQVRDLLIDHHYTESTTPKEDRIRDWICNSQKERFCFGRGKLIYSTRTEVRLNPLWVPPESAFSTQF